MARARKTKAVKGRDLIIVILDESGSMQSCYDATVNGFNEFIANQRRTNPDNCFVTLTTFNGGDGARQTTYVKYTNRPIAEVPELGRDSYRPDHMTALNDAIGITIRGVERDVQPEDRVILLVITDGYENSSREYSKAQAMAIIDEKTATGQWTATYLSASPTAFADAQSYGVNMGNVAQYHASPVGTQQAFAAASHATTTLRSSSAQAVTDFYDGSQAITGGQVADASFDPDLTKAGPPRGKKQPTKA